MFRYYFFSVEHSHYIEYRERAALALATIAPIHTNEKWQGNVKVRLVIQKDASPIQCAPFDDSERPSFSQYLVTLDWSINNIL